MSQRGRKTLSIYRNFLAEPHRIISSLPVRSELLADRPLSMRWIRIGCDSLLPTADDVRDLLSCMRANGADGSLIQEFEDYAKQLENSDTHKGNPRILGSSTITRKLIVAGIPPRISHMRSC